MFASSSQAVYRG